MNTPNVLQIVGTAWCDLRFLERVSYFFRYITISIVNTTVCVDAKNINTTSFLKDLQKYLYTPKIRRFHFKQFNSILNFTLEEPLWMDLKASSNSSSYSSFYRHR